MAHAQPVLLKATQPEATHPAYLVPIVLVVLLTLEFVPAAMLVLRLMLQQELVRHVLLILIQPPAMVVVCLATDVRVVMLRLAYALAVLLVRR